MAGLVTFHEWVENEGFSSAPRRWGRGIGPLIRVEHPRAARSRLMVSILLGGCRGLLRRVRREVEPTFASAATEREHRRAQHDDSPSRRSRAVIASHDNIPNARAPYKHCLALARAGG